MSFVPLWLVLAIVFAAALIRAWRRGSGRADDSTARPVFVLGQALAEARRVEDARVASGPPRQSPLPPQRYAEFPQGTSLIEVEENDLDRRIRALTTQFAAAGASERSAMTASIDMNGLYSLLQFASRSAVFAQRERHAERCTEGMRALAMLDLARIDPRDFGSPLGMLDQAAHRMAVPRASLHHDLLRLASQEVAMEARRYLRRNDPTRPPDRMLWRAVDARSGAGFVASDLSPYHPSADLLAIMLELRERVRAGRYAPEDPTIGTDLPSAWFRLDGPKRPPIHVRGPLGVVTMHATLRHGLDPRAKAQLLIVFLAEMPDAAQAASLAEKAEGALSDGGAALAIAQGRLLCLVVGHAVVRGVSSFETPASIRELIDEFRPILAAG